VCAVQRYLRQNLCHEETTRIPYSKVRGSGLGKTCGFPLLAFTKPAWWKREQLDIFSHIKRVAILMK